MDPETVKLIGVLAKAIIVNPRLLIKDNYLRQGNVGLVKVKKGFDYYIVLPKGKPVKVVNTEAGTLAKFKAEVTEVLKFYNTTNEKLYNDFLRALTKFANEATIGDMLIFFRDGTTERKRFK